MSETRFLKTTLFGGYERNGVEKRFEYLLTQVYSLKNELRESKRLLAELRKGADEDKAVEAVLSSERAKLTQVQVQHESMSKRIKVAEEDLQARNQEIEALKAELEALKEELNEKNIRLSALEAENDAAALSAVFIEAQKSAKLLVDNAKQEAAELEENSKKLAENVVTDANNAAQQIIYDAEVQSIQKTADAEERAAQLETVSGNLRATALEEVRKLTSQVAAMQEAFETFRVNGTDALADSAKRLSEAEASLLEGGVPEFRIAETHETALPEAPVPQPVDHSYYTMTDEERAEKRETNEELERLRQMAESIGGKSKDEAEEVKPEEEKPADPPAADGVPDLAALAAQAAALKKK